jgi:hypothetical protein
MKRLLVILSLTAVALSLAPAVLAQDDSFVCNALLRHGVYDKSREIRSSASASQLQTHICEAYTKLKQDKLAGHMEGHYILAGGEGSYSSDQLEAVGQFMCADSFNASSASSALTVIQDKISPAAMDAYRECVAQNSSGLKTKTQFREEDQGQVTIEVRYVAPVGAQPQTTIDKIVLTPADSFKCQGPLWDLQGKPNGVGTNAVAMSCERKIATTPFSLGGLSVLAGPNTIAVLITSGTLTRSLTTILAAPPPTPLNIPVGTVIAFSGTMADAEAQKQFGWWVCDGRTVDDPLATTYHGKSIPNLSDRFLAGSGESGKTGGAARVTIDLKDKPVESHTYNFGGTPITMDPRVIVWNDQSWPTGAPILSKGLVPPFDVTIMPPFYSVIYLVKVR